ncbi:MAG: hypothetical protein Q8N51_00755 [Gammaproteobacteria bacterium]|nr:hypothetical protein [Gammaproteobacteria bacterium]
MTQTAKPETGGVFECGSCAEFYSAKQKADLKYHAAVRLFARAIYRRENDIIAKEGRTWAEEFQSLTGESLADYIERVRRRSAA